MWGEGLGLCIVYFMQYDTYHDTHEAIFDMYQRYILSKKLTWPQISCEFGNFNDQNNINLSKMYHFKYRLTKMNDTICII